MDRRERTRGGSAVERLQNRRLNFEVIALVEKLADRAGEPRPCHEQRPHLRVDGQVSVALPISLLGIREAGMPHDLPVGFFLLSKRQRTQRLRQQLYSIDPNGDLTSFGAEKRAMYADDVAKIEVGEE